MPLLSRIRRRASPGSLLLLSVIAILAISVGLSYHAWSAARSHQQSVEHTLRDYASMAVWGFTSVARDNLHEFWREAFDDVTWDWRGYGDLPSPGILADEARRVTRRLECDCPGIRNPLAVFRVNLRDSTIVSNAESMAPEILSRVADTLTTHWQRYDDERTGLVMMPAGAIAESPVLITYSTAYGRGRRGEARALYGFLTDPGAYSELLTHWFSGHELLPPSVTGGQPNDSLLELSVHIPGGSTLFGTELSNASAYGASDTMAVKFGGMIVESAIRPEVANQLIIGGLPRSRLPLVLTLLVITIGMGATALYQLRREHQLTRLRDDFVSSVSHELRTPLAQVRMFAELWEAGKLMTEAKRNRSVSIINREALRLTHLVENILQFSRTGRATADIRMETLDVQATMHEVVEAFRPLADVRGVSLKTSIDADLVVRADRDAIKQILLNLLDNAVKYGPEGQTVTIAAGRTDDRLHMSVSDQGPGIPQSERHTVWEPYRRLQRDTQGAATGTGIGLSVVAELAGQHAGHVRIEDTNEGGACLVVELPGATSPTDVSGGQSAETQT